MDEFTVRTAPISANKNFNVFKLHKDDDVTWTEVKMRRENDFQPWQIKLGNGRTARRFKAVKEGGVCDNVSYFVFYKSNEKSDTYEVCPVNDWYNVSATLRYKTLTADEAEQKFEQRNKTLNLFSVMNSKKGVENGEDGEYGQDSRGFKVSEMDDWDDSGDDEASGNDADGDDSKKKNRRKKFGKKDHDDPDQAPDEGKEESDEGDFEQREVDYMSDNSSDRSEMDEKRDETDVKGIAEESALRNLLSTDEEDETEPATTKGPRPIDDPNFLGTVEIKQSTDVNGSDESSDSDDYDVDDEKMDSMFAKKGLPAQLSMVKEEVKQEAEPSSSKQVTTIAVKRKLVPEPSISPPQQPKRICPPEPLSNSPVSNLEKIVEDLIRRYLSRKPMTLKSLLKDIKSKLKRMDGVTPEMDNDLVNTIASIIRRLQPDKQKINEVTYLSLKS